jgi:hypothetical protein
MWDPVVDQQELTAIAIAHGVFVKGHGPAKEGP